MGTHRSTVTSRGFSKGPVIAVVVVLVVLLALALYYLFGTGSAPGDSAAGCAEGRAYLDITVDPEIADPVRTIAQRYNDTKPVVRGSCAEVVVTERASADMVAGFTSNAPWNPSLGPRPALWIPVSSRYVEAMRVPGLVEGQPRSVASSPIVLAVPEVLRHTLASTRVSWADLPGLQQGSLDRLGLPGWNGLRMTLPPGDSTLAAVAAVAGAISGTDPLTAEAMDSGQAITAVSALAAHAPATADVGDALATISTGPPGEADIHAIPVTQRVLAATGGGATGYSPAGAAPIADYPATLITGPWVDKTENLLAGLFAEYLRQPAQQQDLAAAGFGGPPAEPVAAPSRAVQEKLRAALEHPVLGVHATALVDTSSSMGAADGEMPRLANALGAIASTVNVMPPDFGLGLWAVGKNADGDKPYRIAAPTAALTDEHRGEIMGSLGSIKAGPTNEDHCFAALTAAYQRAVDGYAEARTNSILLVTDGLAAGDEQVGRDLLAAVEMGRAKKPIRFDIIVVGDAGSDPLRILSEKTGGTYKVLPGSNDKEFGTAVVNALTVP